MTMLSPVAALIRCSACGSRPMPRQVGSTTVRRRRRRTRAAPRSPAARRRARNCRRLTNGFMRSSPRMPMCTGSSARCCRSGSLGRFHQQRQSLQDVLVHQGDAHVVGRRSGRSTVITLPEPTCGWREQLAHVRSSARARRVKMRVLSQMATRMISAGDDLGEERRDMGEDQAVADDRDGQARRGMVPRIVPRPPNRRCRPAPRPRSRRARSRPPALDEPRAEPRRDHDAGERRGDAGQHIDRRDDHARRRCRRGAPPRHWRRSPVT